MLVFGLLHDRGWDRPEPVPKRRTGRAWQLRWRPLAWVAAWCWLMAMVPVVDRALGALAGYAALLLAVALGLWRVDRWCSHQYWHGLREYKP